MILRRELGLPNGLLVGTVARLHPHKNHALTIEAVASLRSQGTAVTAVLIGEGAQRAELENLARVRGVSEAVMFAGGKRPVAPWIRSLDVFVLPSIWEGQPLALLQAVACGIPVLASRIEGNIAVLGADHPGLFEARDAGHLAKLMGNAVHDPDFVPRLVMRQRQVAIPWSHEAAGQLAAIYRSLLP
jgi:glycosyltransferase involved in cell wall biosynthesis